MLALRFLLRERRKQRNEGTERTNIAIAHDTAEATAHDTAEATAHDTAEATERGDQTAYLFLLARLDSSLFAVIQADRRIHTHARLFRISLRQDELFNTISLRQDELFKSFAFERFILSHSKTECETECEFTCYAPTGLSLSNDSSDSFAFEDDRLTCIFFFGQKSKTVTRIFFFGTSQKRSKKVRRFWLPVFCSTMRPTPRRLTAAHLRPQRHAGPAPCVVIVTCRTQNFATDSPTQCLQPSAKALNGTSIPLLV